MFSKKLNIFLLSKVWENYEILPHKSNLTRKNIRNCTKISMTKLSNILSKSGCLFLRGSFNGHPVGVKILHYHYPAFRFNVNCIISSLVVTLYLYCCCVAFFYYQQWLALTKWLLNLKVHLQFSWILRISIVCVLFPLGVDCAVMDWESPLRFYQEDTLHPFERHSSFQV